MTVQGRLYDANGKDTRVPVLRELAEGLPDEQLLWVDLDTREAERVAEAVEALGLPMESKAIVVDPQPSPRLLRYQRMVHLSVVVPRRGPPTEEGRDETPLRSTELVGVDFLARGNVLLTVHEGGLEALEEFDSQLRGESDLGRLGSGALTAALVDTMLGTYLALAEALERRIDGLDEQALAGRVKGGFLRDVILLRRPLAALRRALAPHRAVLGALVRTDTPIETDPWPPVLDRLERTLEEIEGARELLIGSVEVHMGQVGQRTNDIMKVLTVVNAALLPSAVLAGVMGMNFKLGFFDQPGNFLLVAGFMLAMALGVVGVARWRGWI